MKGANTISIWYAVLVLGAFSAAAIVSGCSGAKTKRQNDGRLDPKARELLDLQSKRERLRVLAQRYDNLWKRVNNRKSSLFDDRDSLISVGRKVLVASARAIEGRSITTAGLSLLLASINFSYEPTAVRFDARVQIKRGTGPQAPSAFGHVRGYLSFRVAKGHLVAALRALEVAPDTDGRPFFEALSSEFSLRNVERWLPELPLAVQIAEAIVAGEKKLTLRVELLDEEIIVLDKKVLIPFRLQLR